MLPPRDVLVPGAAAAAATATAAAAVRRPRGVVVIVVVAAVLLPAALFDGGGVGVWWCCASCAYALRLSWAAIPVYTDAVDVGDEVAVFESGRIKLEGDGWHFVWRRMQS